MCSRYRIVKDKLVITINGRDFEITLRARYNVAPTQKLPTLLPDLDGLKIEDLAWGWKVPWNDQLLINAKAETIQQKETFKRLLHQRCLIPADGFYEWTADKTPIMFTKPGDESFCFGGLWQDTQAGKQFIVLTTTPNEAVGKVNTRMPFIVPPSHYGSWLASDSNIETVLADPDRTLLKSQPVQRALNNAKNEGPELIKPAPVQDELF